MLGQGEEGGWGVFAKVSLVSVAGCASWVCCANTCRPLSITPCYGFVTFFAGSVMSVIAASQRITASCTGVRFVFLICVLV